MSKQVYITNASLNMIYKSLRTKKIGLDRAKLLEYISQDFAHEFEGTSFYDNMHYLFNNYELKEIYFEGLVLKNFEKLLSEIDGNKNIIKQYVDHSNEQYAIKVNVPAFHSSQECDRLNSNFHNIIIPKDCRLNEEMRSKVELWIRANYKSMNFNDLNAKFKIEFQCDCDLEEVDYANSGSSDFNNYDVKLEMKEELHKKFTQLRFFYDHEFVKKIEALKYAPTYKLKDILKHDQDLQTHETIKDFHSVKGSLRKTIRDYYKMKYNKELAFEKDILNAIGFRACRSCNK